VIGERESEPLDKRRQRGCERDEREDRHDSRAGVAEGRSTRSDVRDGDFVSLQIEHADGGESDVGPETEQQLAGRGLGRDRKRRSNESERHHAE